MPRIAKADVNRALQLAASTIVEAGGKDGRTSRAEMKTLISKLPAEQKKLVDVFFKVIDHRDFKAGAQVTAKDVSPGSVTVADVMTRQPLMASETDELGELLQAMRLAGIRRVPVVDVRGSLIGIIALDDAIDVVTVLWCDMAGSIKSEQRQEWRARPA